MRVTRRFPVGSGISSLGALALAFCLGTFCGCLVDQNPGSESSAGDGYRESGVLRGKSASEGSSAPLACSRKWNAAALDSVLYCPDPRPPNPG